MKILNPIEIKDKISSPRKTRFAPSPTGFLHLGHVVSALYVWGLSHLLEAKTTLRLEDHDKDRSRSHYEKQILEDLSFLGFLERKETDLIRYGREDEKDCEKFLEKLVAKNLVYSCFCSRREIKERAPFQGEELCYDGFCRRKDKYQKEGTTLRLKVKKARCFFSDLRLGPVCHDLEKQCGDFALKDRNGYWTYQFSSVVSDLKEGTHLIVRGEDILPSTGRQLYLRHSLGFLEDPIFYHHPLLLEEGSKDKLSKTRESLSIKKLREKGFSPEEILGEASYLGGFLEERKKASFEEIFSIFSG